MKKIKLLLVEDEPVLAEVIKESIEQRGFDICHVANGVDAWTLYKEFEPHICVIDVMLPRKDGFSLALDIRTTNPDIPIIFLTAKTQTADVLKGFASGGDDYLKKPFSREADVLKLLVLHPNRLIERKEVLLKLWGDDNYFNARNMDVYVSKLRNHLRHDPHIEIINIRGRGFKILI